MRHPQQPLSSRAFAGGEGDGAWPVTWGKIATSICHPCAGRGGAHIAAMTWHKYLDRLAMTLGAGCLIGIGLGVLIARM